MRTAFFFWLTLCLSMAGQPAAAVQQRQIPYYFIAVHNEPFNHDQHRFFTEESWGVLRQMVAKADSCHIKLTLMFAPAWADYIRERPERIDELARWRQNGHEISGHHHSVYHGNWDGYTNLTVAEAQAWRRRAPRSERHFGTMLDFMTKLRQMQPDIKSGCMNEEGSRSVLPDGILYGTCSGFANYGAPGQAEVDMNPEKGRNEYVSVGTVNGIERKWLGHHFMAAAAPAINVFSSMRSGVYGVVNHSAPHELRAFSDYLDFLSQVDPYGVKSRTLTQVIEQKLLPEKKLSAALMNSGIPMTAPPAAAPRNQF